MATDNLNNMDVNALLALRADVDRMLAERGLDLQRCSAGPLGKNRGDPLGERRAQAPLGA